MLKPIYEARVKANNKSTPIYIICIGWDKCVGFGIDKDIRVTNDYATFIQVCGEYNIHFIFICSGGVNGIQSSIIAACKYRIVGKVSEQDSYKVIESKLGSKSFEGIKSGYMFLNRSGSISRLKIYQSVQEREIIKDEIVLE